MRKLALAVLSSVLMLSLAACSLGAQQGAITTLAASTPAATPQPATPTTAGSSSTAAATPTRPAASAANTPAATPSPTRSPAQAANSGSQRPPATAAASGPAAFLAGVEALTVPQRDLDALAVRLKGAAAATTPAARPQAHTAGSKDTFWVSDEDSMTHFKVTATLRYVTDHLYMYVDDSISNISDSSVRQSADLFESKTYPTTRRYFGTGWGAGLDGDTHITVLNTKQLGATGAFSSSDEESTAGNPYTNGRHMLYMNMEGVRPGTQTYNAVLAHEFQHAIHYYEDTNEDGWMNEGSSVLNEKLNGYSTWSSSMQSFVKSPNTQLTTWGETPSLDAHYGAAFSFMDYFHSRYGDQALLWLTEEQADGEVGVNRTLDRLGKTERFDDVFGDWVVANILDDTKLSGGRYGYSDLDIHLSPTLNASSLPTGSTVSYPQFAGYYAQFTPPQGSATIYFTGTTQTRLVANTPHSGQYEWWANRADLMDTTLTRSFDLSNLKSATLSFWTWYDTEKDWDYAYVEVSQDGGKTWTTLQTKYTTSNNPVGNNLGNGLTGVSGGGKTAQWVQDQANLTPYAGKKIQIRFEYVTDDAVTNPGFNVDDISIPELNYTDDGENTNGWDAQGFVHSSNSIPQTFTLRLITFGNQTEVRDVPVDDQGRARITIAGVQRAILVVAATAHITSEQAQFQYSIVDAGPGL